ncbi:putative lipoprotein [Bacteriovorax sp. BAL6_X]|uniref:hypothetical protein n=1 Tax=Bacteriovorax sp. BAL6_X TaxID=1201290 RepID=UPI000386985F|nr:hypothetical protein [Bacteriovorax sp. BAL6_X]EPZ51178.1 putative lipoprotein [Bacteriovorax sp. BAL6_X]
MRALLLITTLLGLSSCFKTDADGNAYLFENNNRAVISFEFFNADSTLSWYFGIQNQVGTNATDVEGFNSSQYWCIENIYVDMKSGDVSGATFEVVLNDTPMGTPVGFPGGGANFGIAPGDQVKAKMDCSSCVNGYGTINFELGKCD